MAVPAKQASQGKQRRRKQASSRSSISVSAASSRVLHKIVPPGVPVLRQARASRSKKDAIPQSPVPDVQSQESQRSRSWRQLSYLTLAQVPPPSQADDMTIDSVRFPPRQRPRADALLHRAANSAPIQKIMCVDRAIPFAAIAQDSTSTTIASPSPSSPPLQSPATTTATSSPTSPSPVSLTWSQASPRRRAMDQCRCAAR